MNMELIEDSETSANHNRTPGKYPKEYILDSKQGESLKSKITFTYKNLPVDTEVHTAQTCCGHRGAHGSNMLF